MIVSGLGEDSKLSNYVHELLHQFSDAHTYGSLCHSDYLSPFATCTASGPAEALDPHHVDAFFQSKWGWRRPRVVAVTAPGALAFPAAFGGDGWDGPTIFYNPLIGNDEFFIAEYRNANLGGTDASVAQDSAVRNGLVIWYVQTDANNEPNAVPGVRIDPGPDGVSNSAIPPGSDDVLIFEVVNPGANRELETQRAGDDIQPVDVAVLAVGAPRALRGGNTPWTNSDGEFGLRLFLGGWLDNDTSDTNTVLLRLGPTTNSSNTIGLRWRPNSQRQFIPRLEATIGDPVRPGQTFLAVGEFGVDRSEFYFRLRRSDGFSWYPSIVNARGNQVTVQVPSSLTPGRYELFAADRVTRQESDPLWVEISP